MNTNQLSKIIEVALFTSSVPLNKERLRRYFGNYDASSAEINNAIVKIEERYIESGMMLQKVASGWRFSARPEFNKWINSAREEKPTKYSRALLETLALIAYKQPITRGEIEDVRGVAVSSSILRTLIERQWVKTIGQKEVPGRPSLYATTAAFLDYFNLTSLSQLPPLNELRDLQTIGDDIFKQTNSVSDDYTSVSDSGAPSTFDDNYEEAEI